VLGLRRALDTGETSASAVTAAHLAQIRESDASAFASVHADEALRSAAASDARIREGRSLSVLDGIPVAVKDIIHVAGHRMRAGSESVDVVPATDAVIVARLRAAGAVVLGQTRVHELAYGPSGLNDFDGGARNPRFPSRLPGGSSSGSAAAVAGWLSPLALGSDTGGSIRGPAALCDVVGFKPTYGVLPTDGVLATTPSMDHLGLFARSVNDVRATFEVLAGAFSTAEEDYSRKLQDPSRRLAVFIDRAVETDDSIAAAFAGTGRQLARHGWTLDEVTLPKGFDVMEISSTIMAYESFRVHEASLMDHPERIGEDVRKRLLDGSRVSDSAYQEAQSARSELRGIFESEWSRYAALLSPTIPVEAPLREVGGDATVRRNLVRNTRLQNLLGVPAISIPGRGQPRPWGLQLFTAQGQDLKLLGTAQAVSSDLFV